MNTRLGSDGRFFEVIFSVGTACGLSDAELLERFVSGHDETAESALESLILRHGPMLFETDSTNIDSCHDFEALHQEIERLPRKYRDAVVLCYLEGMSLEAAAEQIGCPIGTIGVRLMRAKERLRVRLTRRADSAMAGLVIADLSAKSARAALLAVLVGSTLHAASANTATGILPTAAARLTREVLRSMVMVKLKLSAAIVVAIIAVGSLGGFLVHSRMLKASEIDNPKPIQAPASWVGKKAVTKYSVSVRSKDQVANRERLFRVYTVEEIDGARVRLASEDVSGWIEAKEIVLLDEAIEFYSQEIRIKPSNAAAFHERGLVWDLKDENDKALADFTEAIRLDPKDAAAFAHRGDILRVKAKYDQAIADYNQAIQIDPQKCTVFNSRGRAWSAKRQDDKAIADFTEAIRLDPQFVWGYQNRGDAWSNKKEYDKAIADFTEAIRLEPTSVSAYDDRGDAWSEKKEYDKAIADFSEAMRLDPKYVWAFRHRGRAWSEKKEYDKAIADYSDAIRIDPGYGFSYQNRGDLWSDKGNLDKAIADYTQAIRIDPQSAWAYSSRGRAWSKKHEYDKAIADYTEASRLDPNDAYFVNCRGDAWAGKHEYEKAIADYTEASRLDPNDAYFVDRRGDAWSRKHEYEKAIADYTEAIRIDPRFVIAYRNRADAWSGKHEYEKAMDDYNEAVRINPEDADGLMVLALFWTTRADDKNRDGKKALELAAKACELTKWTNANHLETLAVICATMGDLKSAAEWQTKANALQTDPQERAHGESLLRLYQDQIAEPKPGNLDF